MRRLTQSTLVPLVLFGAAVNAAPAPVANVNGSSINDRVAVLERMVESRGDMQHRLQTQLDDMQQEVNQIRGDLEVHSHKLEQILQRQRELYLEIDKRIEMAMRKPSSTNSSGDSNPAPEPQMSADESTMYDQAVNLILKDKKYEQAIPQFQSFLTRFPKSEYAPNAHYWLGLLLFNKQEWASAKEHFSTVVSFYPDSTKRADSLLKLGVVALRQNNKAQALKLFEQVVKEYPDSSVRKLAESRIKGLK
ncbi:tol-pal system protein YbgF [Alteromonas sp. a30]|uniref:tol-pal system protein YbgF n=1 Tax=Alteromonas sp. a30 TaxID=2730917 RepID=UPI00227F5F1E|nr:tol-pal system protein YbgF [Alteromonas sp. a30]MCY7295138.1 tol-pal system protein YbgF [Alteromonas sp. a30]